MPEESFPVVDGCRIRMMRDGRGAPLLFLHGGNGASEWRPFMADLAQTFDVIVPEHPGFGASDTPEWLDNVGDLAYFYLDLIDALGLAGVHLVGTSLGGWLAAEIAVRGSRSLASLVLAAAAGIHLDGVAKGDIFMWSAEEAVRNLFHDPQWTKQALERPLSEAEQTMAMKNRATMARLTWQPRLYNPHLAKWLHRIDVPTLILWGDDDKVIPPAYGKAFAELIPHSRLEVIRNCGHVAHIERKDEFVGRITRFTAGIPARTTQ
jgi:pimeloyl-ACP methyl ester carboxylesterase